MPVSGSKETGVISRQSSSCSAGVPIKKRRFPLVRPPSPPPQEPSSLYAENESLQKEHSNPSQESTLSDASVATNSPGLSDTNRNFFPEERKAVPTVTNVNSVQNNVNLTSFKLEEPSLTSCLGSMDNVDSKEKLLLTENFVCQKTTENIDLHLVPSEALPLNVGKGIPIKQKVESDCKLELTTVTGNTELSLGLNEPYNPVLAVQNCEQSYRIPEKVDHSSVSLSLGKGKPVAKCKSDGISSKDDGASLHANRCNWDLNTTMDAWEGSIGDTATGHGAVCFDGSNGIGRVHDVKSSVSTAGFGVSLDSGKQILGGGDQRTNFPISSLSSSQQNKFEDSLHLRLSTSCFPANFGGEPSTSSTKIATTRHSLTSVGLTVKSEPMDESAKLNLAEGRGNPKKSLEIRTVKHEVVEKHSLEALKMSNTSPQKLVEGRTIKAEPVQDNQETQRTTRETSQQSDGKVVQCENNCASIKTMPLNPQKSNIPGLLTHSTEFSTIGDTSNQRDYSDYTKEVINNSEPHEICENVDQFVPSANYQSKGSNVSDGKIETSTAKDLHSEDSETGRLKLMNELPPDSRGKGEDSETQKLKLKNELAPDSRGNGEGSVSDEEKFNISTDMLEDDPYSSDCESDGNHAVGVMGAVEDRPFHEEDEYEDGEVREQLLYTASEGPIVDKRDAENVTLVDCDIKNVDYGSPGDGIGTETGVNEKERKLEDCGDEMNDVHIKECADAVLSENADQGIDEDGLLQDSLAIDVAIAESDEMEPTKATQRKLLDDRSRGNDDQKGHESEVFSAGTTNGSQGTVLTVGQAVVENTKGIDTLEKVDSTMPKTDSSVSGNDATKDANTGGNRSRIINLPRGTNVSPCRTSPFPGSSLPTRSGRERYANFEGGKLHPRGNRNEIYYDGPRKFSRERIQDHSFRNSRVNFMRGRGRFSNRLDTLRGDWDSDRDFAPEIYNDPADYRFSRHKRASAAAADSELDCSGYIVAPDGAIIDTGRGGRKLLNDELPSFRHPSSRRRSPGGRDGPPTRGIHMVRRISRNFSPSRCIGEDGSDMVGIGRGEKFTRGLQDDVMDRVFTRPQPPYNEVDGQFARGSRNFSSVQRRGIAQIRSKSPIRARTRSPGPWSSPRRRSPDGFNGLPDLTRNRSPAIYRMERMRSPDRPCFPDDILARRHGSPPYSSRQANNLRDIESRRDHGHPRSVMPNRRSPSDRILPRSTRRFLDPRERTDTDEYFAGPMHSGRFHELGDDGNGDERRKCGERRGPVRSFRPHYNNSAEAENFRFHIEDGPRPFRFCPEADSELREREFDGRIKNRSVNAPRRTRSGIEEQEGNYRHGGQAWNEDGFDDVSRVKRRRF